MAALGIERERGIGPGGSDAGELGLDHKDVDDDEVDDEDSGDDVVPFLALSLPSPRGSRQPARQSLLGGQQDRLLCSSRAPALSSLPHQPPPAGPGRPAVARHAAPFPPSNSSRVACKWLRACALRQRPATSVSPAAGGMGASSRLGIHVNEYAHTISAEEFLAAHPNNVLESSDPTRAY
ncbi:hypothetical protein TRIUR3_12799 [Triticum urartu]|uniref:Uncharacterized protein n=1 Tax=Triticum urartu TaxID=4572 RepID=M7ZYY2_TRIUA|nr:hypothetical protein TRIUR3_12799 [Triticum urartu]